MATVTPRVSEARARQSRREREGGRPAPRTLVSDATVNPERARLLSMHSFPHVHSELFSQLCDQSAPDTSEPFEPKLCSRWEQFLGECERITNGVVLLDLDEAERSSSLRSLGISAHRLCSLILRDLREKPAALILLTRHDYSEIEDLPRAGVAALLHPRHGAEVQAERTRVALHRRRTAQASHRERTHEKGADVVTQVALPAHLAQVEEPPLAPMPLLLPPGSTAPVAL